MFHIYIGGKIYHVGTSKMAQWIRMHTALLEDLSSVPVTHIVQLTVTQDSRELTPSSGLQGHCTQKPFPASTHIIKINKRPTIQCYYFYFKHSFQWKRWHFHMHSYSLTPFLVPSRFLFLTSIVSLQLEILSLTFFFSTLTSMQVC